MKIETTMEPKIYVACLAAYNNGELHGAWIDANQDAEDVQEEIAKMLTASPVPGAEEWAIHDYEGFGEIHISEWESIARVAVLAQLIEVHGDSFTLWYTSQNGCSLDNDDLERQFLEQWQGAHDSEAAFAEYFLEDAGQLSEIPAWARNYLDFAGFARDWELNGDFTFVSFHGQVHVYSAV